MAALVIHIELDDLDELMAADARYAGATGQEPVVSRSSVHFYQRSGHSFVARDGTNVRGFVLAHASWSGGRPVVRVERLVGDATSVGPLVEAVVKSAYDAGVYDIVATVPASDDLATDAFGGADFEPLDARVLVRVLGSRGPRPTSRSAANDEMVAGASGQGGRDART